VSEGAGIARLDYGPDGKPNGLQVEANGKTNKVSQSCDASAKNGAGELSNIADRTSIVKGETAHLIEATNDSSGPEWNFQQHSGGLEHVHFILEKSSYPASASLIRVETDGNTTDILKYDWGSYDLSITRGAIPSGKLKSRILSADGPNGGTLVEIFAWWDENESFNVDGAKLDIEIWPDADGARNGCIHHYTGFSEGPPGGSPIITDASSVTRAADDYTIFSGGAPNWFNNSEGTWLFSASPQAFSLVGGNQMFDIDDDVDLYLGSTSSYRLQMNDGDNVVVNSNETINAFSSNKIAASFTKNKVRLSYDGNSKVGDHNGDAVQNVSTVTLCPNSLFLFDRVVYIPQALTESTLNAITTPDAPEITLTDANGLDLSAYVRA
jgi:hypothetical protein